MGTALWAPIVWLTLGGLYLFLAGDVGTVEIIAGLVCASGGTALAIGLDKAAHKRFRLRPSPHALLRYAAALATDTLSVGRQLVGAVLAPRDRRGTFVRQPFDPGRDGDAGSAGRRAVAVLGLSLAPGSFVIRGERSDVVILHALPDKSASPDRRWPT